MNIRIKLLFVALFFSIKVIANNQVIISLNMNECNSCYNALSYLDDLDKDIRLIYVFPEANRVDSLDIQELFSLPERGQFIWSDQLNNLQLIDTFFSSITYSNIEGHNPIAFSVKNELDGNLINYFNQLNKQEGVFHFNENIFTPAYSNYFLYEERLFWINRIKGELGYANFIDGKTGVFTNISQEMIDAAYLANFESKEVAEARKAVAFDIAERYKLKMFQSFKNFDIYNDKLYTIVQYLDYEFKNDFKDTLELGFYALHIFNENKELEETYSLNYSISEDNHYLLMSIKNDLIDTFSYTVFPAFTFKMTSDSSFYVSVIGEGNTLHKDFKAYFLGEVYIENKKINSIQYIPAYLEERYRYLGYNHFSSQFSWNRKAFVNLLNDKVYIKENGEFLNYSMTMFGDISIEENMFNVQHYNLFVNVFNDDIFILFKNNNMIEYHKGNSITLRKYAKSIIKHTEILKFGNFILPDHIDYNYVLYPISNNEIKRIKIY